MSSFWISLRITPTHFSLKQCFRHFFCNVARPSFGGVKGDNANGVVKITIGDEIQDNLFVGRFLAQLAQSERR